MGERKARHGFTGEEVTHLGSWWDKMRKSCISVEFDSFDEFLVWSKKAGWKYGMKLSRRDLNGPYSIDNCWWRDAPITPKTLETHKEIAEQWDKFIKPIRERYASELVGIQQPKETVFRYEHPDLVREGIVFEHRVL